eukprot:6407071-Pyramimonas_sp.AAC.1
MFNKNSGSWAPCGVLSGVWYPGLIHGVRARDAGVLRGLSWPAARPAAARSWAVCGTPARQVAQADGPQSYEGQALVCEAPSPPFKDPSA